MGVCDDIALDEDIAWSDGTGFGTVAVERERDGHSLVAAVKGTIVNGVVANDDLRGIQAVGIVGLILKENGLAGRSRVRVVLDDSVLGSEDGSKPSNVLEFAAPDRGSR